MSLDEEESELQTNEGVGEANAESYELKKSRKGRPLRLKDAAKVTLIDALMVEILWAFWMNLIMLLGYATLVQVIVIVMVFLDVYLLRRNIRSPSGGPIKGSSGQKGNSGKEEYIIKY